jgi:hypothetical protein
MEYEMPRYGNDRDRDECGRFTEDHDLGHERGHYASRDQATSGSTG